jgi:hypothetical protein
VHLKILPVFTLLVSGVALAQDPFLGVRQFGIRPGSASHDLLGITPFVSAGVSYDTGLGGSTVGSDGKLPNISSGGFYVSGGVTGVHRWRRDTLGIAYSTGYNQSFRFDQVNGINTSLTLGWTHEFTRRTVSSVAVSASMGNQAFGMPGSVGLGGLSYLADGYNDPNLNYGPNNELVDSRNYGVAVSGDLAHNLTRDWAVGIGGTGFTVIRSGSQLIDSYGTGARGQMSRKFHSKNAGSIGIGYDFNLYTYTKGIGDMTVHSVSLFYSRPIGRKASLSLSGGAARVERIGLERFSIDPALQEILGVSSATRLVYGINYFGMGNASLSRSFRRHSVSVGGTLGTNPGNGIYLGSRSMNAQASYSYSGFGRWGVSASGGYSRFQSLMVDVKPYEGYSGTGGISRALVKNLSMSVTGGIRHTRSGNNDYIRTYAFASFGLGWAPGAFRLPGWW